MSKWDKHVDGTMRHKRSSTPWRKVGGCVGGWRGTGRFNGDDGGAGDHLLTVGVVNLTLVGQQATLRQRLLQTKI